MMRETLVQAMLSVAVLCFSILVGFVGLGFLVAGLYLNLELRYTPSAAAALTGMVLLVLALLILLVCRTIMTPRRPPQRSVEAPTDDLTGLLKDAAAMKDASRRLERVLKNNFPVVAGGAFATGFLLGVNPEARHSLVKVLSDVSSDGLDIFMKSQSGPDSRPDKSER
jgi:hypothetical protein